MIVSIDSGSSYLKFAFGDKISVEPSLIEEVSARSSLIEKVQFKDKWYVAGKRAEQQKGEMNPDPELENFHGTDRQEIQLIYAFERNGIEGKHQAIVLSLPYDDFADQDLVKQIQGKKTFTWNNSKSEPRSVHFEQVFVVPQGVGALALYQETEKKTPKLLTLVDIGSCTTDVVSVVWDAEDNTYIFKEKLCTSLKDISTSVFMRKLRDKINEKRPVPIRIGYHELDRAIRNGKYIIQVGSQEIDFKEHFEGVKVKFTQELSTKLEELLGDAWRASNEVVLAGGGAAFVNEWDCERRTTRMDGLANVKGQILAIREMLQ